MLTPLPTQRSGAKFLADRRVALLADAPRVGKTGAAIIGADYVMANRILVVTTASGRPVWRRGFLDWSKLHRKPVIATKPEEVAKSPVIIVSWPSISNPKMRVVLLQQKWDLLILDESHAAKNHEAARTRAVYGEFLDDGAFRSERTAIENSAKRVWCLSGTPIPHAPNDLYPMMRALLPESMTADAATGWPDVSIYQTFLHRYCQVRRKKISNFNWIDVVMGGKNLDELRARLDGFMLRRTQEDVGIRPPVYETLPLVVSERNRRATESGLDAAKVLAAAEAGDTKALNLHLGPLRRLTGEIKARAVVDAVKDEFDSGLDKIVLMYWHTEVGNILKEGLSHVGVVGIDGATPPDKRDKAVEAFKNDPKTRVFAGQILAAGEAIDLSAAATLWFVETSTTPKDMSQASLRVTNHEQHRQAVVRVCVLEGSIDEALQQILLRLWSAIREVLK